MYGLPTLLFLAATAGADLQTLSGKKLVGDLVGLDKQTLVLKTSSGDVNVPVADVLQLDFPPPDTPLPAGPYYDVELTDGSVFHCPQVAIKGGELLVTAATDMKLSLPLTAVYSILRDAHDPKVRADWQKFVAKRGRFDMLAVRGADSLLNAVEGTFGLGLESGDGIEFTHQESGKKLSPKFAKVQGLLFVPRPGENVPPTLCRATDAAGNRVVAADVTARPDGVRFTTVSGVRVAYASLAKLAKLDFSKGKLTFLSDLSPAVESDAFAAVYGDPFDDKPRKVDSLVVRKDATMADAPIKLDGTTFPKGLTVRGGTRLTYELNGDYKEFRATLGVDPAIDRDFPAEVVIEGDGRVLAKEPVSRRDRVRSIAVDIKGVQKLRVSVAAKGETMLGAQVCLADAKVSK